MWIEFKNYQEKAIVKLKQETNDLLDSDGNKVCIFKAPTGSGKTLMMAEYLKRLIDSRIDGKKFSFIWLAVNKLHDQSRNNLKKYYDQFGVGIKCSYYDDLDNKKISENEILFLNWASINKKGNIYIRANERDNNLSAVITRTKEEGRIIILIIDESHHTASSDKSKELIQDIAPKVTVEVSATPQLNNANRIVEVELKDVKDEGMIKKEIAINQGFNNYIVDKKKNDTSADSLVLESAINKRLELVKKLEKTDSPFNPLVLIQIPDSISGVADRKDSVITLLEKFRITTTNGKLAIYLSEKDNKINLDNIEKNNNEVEVMIFKQAIALGWDCPRATILVLFRQWKEENMTFSIQTIGRIMRMPEQRHYEDSELNIGYVYTSLEDIKVAEDISRDYITVFEGRRDDIKYTNVDLISYHSKRFREETRLSSDFVPIFFEAAKQLNLDSHNFLDHSLVSTKIIADGIITDSDKQISTIEKKGILNLPKNEVELQNAFDMYVRNNLAPFAPELRSIKRINDCIYRFFEQTYKMGVDDWPKIQAMVLAEENKQSIINTINKAKELYEDKVGKGKNELIQNDDPWNVPKILNYNLSYKQKRYSKSIIQPYFSKSSSNGSEEESALEVAFIDFLENEKQVKWWFKNGKSDATYFAVPHTEHNTQKPFYVDFIVMLKNGKLGLFDTKGGYTAELAGSRAEGLAKYISEQNKVGKKLFGGIVLKEKNSWRVHNKNKYSYNPNNLSDWDFVNLN